MIPRVTVNAGVEMVEFVLFQNKNRVARSHADVEAIIKVDAHRPNGGAPMVEIRFADPEAALRLSQAALEVWKTWKESTANE